MLPAWLTFSEAAHVTEAIPERAAVVRNIFEKADAGWGQHRIAQWLNEQRIPTWGGRGNQRRAEQWHRSYVKKILTNSAVVGTFTPHQKRADAAGKRQRRPLEAIQGYFPVVVDRNLFERVASRLHARAPRGRNATNEPASIFAGVLRCALCGGVVTRVSKGEHVYLVCSRANRRGTKDGGCKYLAVRYGDVEAALVVNARAIIEDAPRGLETEEIEAEIANLDAAVDGLAFRAEKLADEAAREQSEAARRRGRAVEAEWKRARENLRALRARRDALTRPFVERRLNALEEALLREPLDVAGTNRTLKEAVSKIVLSPETGTLAIYWHHAAEATRKVPFFSRHSRMFDDEHLSVQDNAE